MNETISNDKNIIGVLSILLVFGVSVVLLPDNIGDLYEKNYLVDTVCIIVCLILYLILYQRKLVDLFSPCSFFTLLYIVMFFVTPMYDIVNGEYLWFGKDLFDQGIKSSFMALIGYFFFFIFTRYKFIFGRKRNFILSGRAETWENEIVDFKGLLFIIIGYFICLIANIYYLVASGGISITYVLSLGMLGGTTEKIVRDIGAISMLAYALPSFTLLYVEYGKNRVFKVISFLIMFELQVARGFRFFILQIVVMFGSYYFLKNKKKPTFLHILLGIALTMIPLILMTLFRTTIRSGMGMDISSITSNSIKDAFDAAFWDNLRIYKNYYALIKVVPKQTNYLFGAQTIIYTAIMLIPRAFWPTKPGNPGTVAQKIALGQVAVVGGSAYPALGEYYYDFGLFGIIVWMSIFSLFLRKIENRFRFHRKSLIDLMIYCSVLGTVLQFTIRGYMPSNFWMLIFCILPYVIIKKIVRGKE